MKTHCLHCNGRQAPGNRTTGSGRIDYISRVNDELAWVVWKCPKCDLVWSTPLLGEESAGNAIAEHMLAIAGTDGIIPDPQRRINKQVSKSHECKHSLPTDLCTICPTNYGVGRVS